MGTVNAVLEVEDAACELLKLSVMRTGRITTAIIR